MPLNTAKIDDFSGGANAAVGVLELEKNEWQYSATQDVEIMGGGKSLKGRRGMREFTLSTALPSMASSNNYISSARTFRLDQNSPDSIMISNHAGLIASLNPNTFPATLTTVLAAASTAEYEFIQSQDATGGQYVWMINGVSTPQKYNISTTVMSAWAGSPPNGTCMKVWKNMMVISGVTAQPQRLYYSKIADPETWSTPGGFIDIKSTDDESDAIIALEVIGENLLVFKQNSVWLVFDPVSFDNRRIESIGCVFRSAVVKFRERVYWMAVDGLYSSDGDSVKEESINIRPIFTNESLYTAPFDLIKFRDWTRLSIHPDGLLILTNRMSGGSTFGMHICNLNITRQDKQHPWVYFGARPAGYVAVSVAGNFRFGHNPANSIRPAMIGVFSDNQTSTQYAVDVLDDSSYQDRYNGANQNVGFAGYRSPGMAIQGTENLERIRRVNLLMAGDSNTVQTFKWYADLQNPSVYNTTVVPLISLPNAGRFLRVRPEVRARIHEFSISLVNGAELFEVEMKYRGGKEH